MTVRVLGCDWCGDPFTTSSPTARTCSDDCRLMLSKWRRGIGPFAPGADGHVDGRRHPASPDVAREHRDRDAKRAARAAGRIPSDQRLQRSRAIEAAVACIRQVARVSVGDARVIAAREVDARMPGAKA